MYKRTSVFSFKRKYPILVNFIKFRRLSCTQVKNFSPSGKLLILMGAHENAPSPKGKSLKVSLRLVKHIEITTGYIFSLWIFLKMLLGSFFYKNLYFWSPTLQDLPFGLGAFSWVSITVFPLKGGHLAKRAARSSKTCIARKIKLSY